MDAAYQSDRDIRRLRVWELSDAGMKAQDVADDLGIGIATVYRDRSARNIQGEVPEKRGAGRPPRLHPAPPPPPEPPPVAPFVPPPTPRKPRIVTPDRVPPDPESQEAALSVAIMLWRMHVPDPLVAVRAMGVSPAMLQDWLNQGLKDVADGVRESWSARCYLAKGLGLTESLTGYDEQVGIIQRLHQIVQSKDDKASLGAIKLLLERGSLRNFYGQSIDVNVQASLPTAPLPTQSTAASGLADALALIGAEASADASA